VDKKADQKKPEKSR